MIIPQKIYEKYSITPVTWIHIKCNGYILAKTFFPQSKDQPNAYCIKCNAYIDTTFKSSLLKALSPKKDGKEIEKIRQFWVSNIYNKK